MADVCALRGLLHPPAFQIGTRPVPSGSAWLAQNDDVAKRVAEKRRMLGSMPREAVFMARDDTLAAQGNVRELISRVPGANPLAANDDLLPPLLAASMQVTDDLVIMRECADGWRLVAASLFAPSYWSLAEKFDRPLDVIHAPVPGFGTGERKAVLVNRMFSSLPRDVILERRNWSLHGDGGLFKPKTDAHNVLCDTPSAVQLGALFVRREYQTVRRLDVAGDILFTIRVTMHRLRDVKADRAEGVALADAIGSLDERERAYKGIGKSAAALAAYLNAG
ncbi:MAG: heme-dependent oxidative N-demethylase subunit alpha family protein [Pseudomonadota bacterium]